MSTHPSITRRRTISGPIINKTTGRMAPWAYKTHTQKRAHNNSLPFFISHILAYTVAPPSFLHRSSSLSAHKFYNPTAFGPLMHHSAVPLLLNIGNKKSHNKPATTSPSTFSSVPHSNLQHGLLRHRQGHYPFLVVFPLIPHL